MKTFLATTATIALLVSSPLLAQDAVPAEPGAGATPEMQHSDPAAAPSADPMATDPLFLPTAQADNRYASDLIGMDVYSSAADYGTYSADPVASADRSGWDSIGQINDIALSADGQVQAVLVDIGGFLGMGVHTVALDMSQVHFLSDENGNHFVAVNSTREALEAAPGYERTDTLAQTAPAVAPGDPAAAPADPAMAPVATAPGTDPVMTRPAFTREGFADVDYAQLTAADLDGATVYDLNDDSIGSVSELVLGADGTIEHAVVDVGGFLGIGAHSVALDFDELQIMRDEGGTVRVYIDETREQLEARPAHAG